MSILSILLDRYRKYKDPVTYYRKRGMKIGNNCEFRGANFGSEPYLITIGNHVRINAAVTFVTHDGGVWVIRNYEKYSNDRKNQIDVFGKICVGNNVHIGTGAIIMPGISIGNNCVIGCGAVVTKDIPDNSIAIGVPARVIETIDDYIAKNENGFIFTNEYDTKKKRSYLEKTLSEQK